MKNRALLLVAALVCAGGCGGADARAAGSAAANSVAEVCRIAGAGVPLPDDVRETSGLARSVREPGLLWTHNDAGHEAELFGIDTAGALVQRVRVTGAGVVDWEDIESAPCGDETCLYIADIGDNDAHREYITIYRVPEPASDAASTGEAVALHARFPGGPRDAEALFATAAGELYVVTKGRREEIALFRVPPAWPAGEPVTLEQVRVLFPKPGNADDRVTAATTSPDGRWTGIRSYRTLYLYRTADLLSPREVEPLTVDLAPLAEAQGEALVLANDGSAWLTSEAEEEGAQPRLSRLRCSLPDAP